MNLYNVPGIEKYKPRKVLVGIIQNFPWIGGVTMGKVVALLWIALILSALITFPGTAKAEDTNWWMKTYGGSRDDRATAVALAPNGDIIVVGNTRGPGVGSDDALVLRLDGRGNVKWEKVYGGGDYDRANAVAVAPNGDIIIAGETKSFGAGNTDAWVLRLDENGDVKWGKTYGGSDNDGASGVAIAPNGDIIVVGDTKSFGAGGYDLWVLRLDENGNIKWEKTYGGDTNEGVPRVVIAPNGDIIVAGETDSFGAGLSDVWVLRLDGEGDVKWQKTYGGDEDDGASAVAVAPSRDIIVAGYTHSFGGGEAWVLRIDGNGDVKWGKTFRESRYGGWTYAVALADNGDILLAGEGWRSFGGNSDTGSYDLWVLRLNGEGNVRWEKTYGGKYGEEARAITLADNGDVIVAGYTDSFGVGDKDVWVLRLPPDGNLPGCRFSYNSNSQVSEPTPNIEDSNAEIHESHAEVKYSNAHPNPGTPTVKTQCAHSKSKVPLSPKAVGAIAATGVAVIAIYKGIKR
jgi:uncharacterized delta-60 repeat protein